MVNFNFFFFSYFSQIAMAINILLFLRESDAVDVMLLVLNK